MHLPLNEQKVLLDALKKITETEEGLKSDPLRFVHTYRKDADREVVALLSALFAYGNVKAMTAFLDRLFRFLGPSPAAGVREVKNHTDFPGDLYYRFQSQEDVAEILRTIGRMLDSSPSDGFEDFFGKPGDPLNVRIDIFRKHFYDHRTDVATRGVIHWCGKLASGGASKRFAMFLRWMTRNEWPDTGLYKSFLPRDLVIPLDVHMARMGKKLGWTGRTTSDWKTASEITASLKLIAPEDPLCYDFALTRPGITGACQNPDRCSECPLHPACMYR